MSMTERPVIRLNLDALNQMRPRDLHEMEQRLGKTFGSMANMNIQELDALQLWGLAFLQARRTEPDVTWEQVGEMDITFAPDPEAAVPGPLDMPSTFGESAGSE